MLQPVQPKQLAYKNSDITDVTPPYVSEFCKTLSARNWHIQGFSRSINLKSNPLG